MMTKGKDSKASKKLAMLAMPGKRGADKELELDLDMAPEGSDEEEAAESPEEERHEMEMGEGDSEDKGESDLAKVPDDELLAEIKKRGLTADMGMDKNGKDDGEDDDYTLRA